MLGVDGSQLRFQIFILSKPTAKTGVHMKHKIIYISHRSLHIHFPLCISLVSWLTRKIMREEKTLSGIPGQEKCIRVQYNEGSSFPRSSFNSPSSALWIAASDRSINGGIPEA